MWFTSTIPILWHAMLRTTRICATSVDVAAEATAAWAVILNEKYFHFIWGNKWWMNAERAGDGWRITSAASCCFSRQRSVQGEGEKNNWNKIVWGHINNPLRSCIHKRRRANEWKWNENSWSKLVIMFRMHLCVPDKRTKWIFFCFYWFSCE